MAIISKVVRESVSKVAKIEDVVFSASTYSNRIKLFGVPVYSISQTTKIPDNIKEDENKVFGFQTNK